MITEDDLRFELAKILVPMRDLARPQPKKVRVFVSPALYDVAVKAFTHIRIEIEITVTTFIDKNRLLFVPFCNCEPPQDSLVCSYCGQMIDQWRDSGAA